MNKKSIKQLTFAIILCGVFGGVTGITYVLNERNNIPNIPVTTTISETTKSANENIQNEPPSQLVNPTDEEVRETSWQIYKEEYYKKRDKIRIGYAQNKDLMKIELNNLEDEFEIRKAEYIKEGGTDIVE